jgi:hypothetical protein
MDHNSGDSSASVHMSLAAGQYSTTELNSILVPLITPWYGPYRKYHFQQFLYMDLLPWEHVCLQRRYSVTAAHICLLRICCPAADVSLSVSQSLASNGSLHATMFYHLKYAVPTFNRTFSLQIEPSANQKWNSRTSFGSVLAGQAGHIHHTSRVMMDVHAELSDQIKKS